MGLEGMIEDVIMKCDCPILTFPQGEGTLTQKPPSANGKGHYILGEWKDVKTIARSITLAENGEPYPHAVNGKPEHEYFATADTFYYKSLKEFALKHRGNPTEAENVLWQQIRDKQLDGIKFRRQHIIDKYIEDFISLENKLII